MEDDRELRIEHVEAFAQFQRDDGVRVTRYANELGLKLNLPVYTTILLMVEAYDPGPIESIGRLSLGALTVTLQYRIVRLWELPVVR